MKKIIIAILLIFVMNTSAYAVNVVDTLVCKKVVLRGHNATILVNRITGEVKYILRSNNRWVLLKGRAKKNCQVLYDAQVAAKKR